MSVTKTVVLATSSSDAPQSARTARMLASVWRACASTPSAMRPLAGSIPTCPARMIQSPARTAAEYGPAAGGALGVGIGSIAIGVTSGIDARRASHERGTYRGDGLRRG